jgi:hypothetical protein
MRAERASRRARVRGYHPGPDQPNIFQSYYFIGAILRARFGRALKM